MLRVQPSAFRVSWKAQQQRQRTTQHIYRLALEGARRGQRIAYDSNEVWIGLYVRTQLLGITLQYSSQDVSQELLDIFFVERLQMARYHVTAAAYGR